MIAITIILLFFILLLSWLLFVPIIMEADSELNLYRVTAGFLFSATIIKLDEHLVIRIQIAGYTFDLKEFNMRYSGKKRNAGKRKKTGLNRSKMFRRIERIFRSFRVKMLQLDIDTGDFTWNAMMIPLFVQINRPRHYVHINFNGHTSIHIIVQNRLIRILSAFIFTK